jgi:periplasmic protein TonB
LLSEADFTAEPVERLDTPEPPTPAERRFHVVAIIAAAALHILIPVSFILYYWLWPHPVPTVVQEIPVEVVQEEPPPPPKPKPKPPEEQQKPPPPPEAEKPAYDAPAAPTKEKVNRDSPDKTTEAKANPDKPPPPTPGAPPKAETPAPEPKPVDQQKADTTPPSHDLTSSPEGELPADNNPKEEEKPAQGAAPAAPPAEAKAPVGAPVPTIEDLPQYKFARSVENSPVAGGNSESRYLTIIYGMIKAHLHESPSLHIEQANRHGIIDFYVDEGGNLVGRRLVSSSGSTNLDIAVMAAIAEAAPYPAPPNWSPVSLNYNFGRSPREAGGH